MYVSTYVWRRPISKSGKFFLESEIGGNDRGAEHYLCENLDFVPNWSQHFAYVPSIMLQQHQTKNPLFQKVHGHVSW